MRDSLHIMQNDARLADSESKLKQQRTVRTALIIGIVLVAAFLLLVFNRLRVIRKQKKQIEYEKKIREEQHLLLEEKNREILDSINYAWRIQHGMIPPVERVTEIFPESFILHLPKDKLSGDFYWVGRVQSQVLGELKIFAVADCTGHGIPGALVSITGINYIKLGEQQSNVNSPAQALDFVNKGFYDLFHDNTELNVRDGMDAAMGAIQMSDLTMYYASAKNSILIIRNNQLIELQGDKHPIGRFGPPEPIPFTSYTYKLQKNDMLFVFSDGFADQFGGPKGRKFKSGELKKLLIEISSNHCKSQYELLLKRFNEWKGTVEQTDDVTIMGIRI
jgi:serine phosphatase RsbU (regulator of sigma subunit)